MKPKFKLGQEVFWIQNIQKQLFKKCRTCDATGNIFINKEKFVCPKCYGRCQSFDKLEQKYRIEGNYTIGYIRHTAWRASPKAGTQYKTEYMMFETGIESGSLYREEHLFATRQEAQDECDRLNEKERESNESVD